MRKPGASIEYEENKTQGEMILIFLLPPFNNQNT